MTATRQNGVGPRPGILLWGGGALDGNHMVFSKISWGFHGIYWGFVGIYWGFHVIYWDLLLGIC